MVNKTAGIEVVGENSLTYNLHSIYDFIEPCHRLDRNTSGLIIFAKNKMAEETISSMIKEHMLKKIYRCISG